MPGGSRRNADEAFLSALACGATTESAARSAGISISTAYRRLNDPAFRQRLQQVRADIVKRTAGALTAASTEAVKTLIELQKANTPPTVRLGAARAIIEMSCKLREITELSDRLRAVEEQITSDPAPAPKPESSAIP
ncbi:MAG TPA: hypothetical protein VFE62_29030 [Gemmataceae bacterium]|nr:hypothetical protein [Gemmataceae bacterium]